MTLDLIFILLLVVMGALGAWRGAVVSGAGLFSLVAGYLGALIAATRGAGWVERTLVVSPVVAPAIAGTLGFVVAWLVVSSLLGVLIAWDKGRVELGGRPVLDRVIGAGFGLARGGLIVVLLAVLVSWLDAARDLGVIGELAALPDAEESSVAGASGALVESAVHSALADAGPAAEIAARVAARPGQTLGSVQTILEDERLNGLFADKLFWTLIQNDSIDYAMNRRSVRSIVHDPEMRGRFADLGLVEESAREDPDAFRKTLARVLADVAPRVERLHTDPEMRSLASDPEIIALVESGNVLALFGHPRIRSLVEKLTATP